MYSEIYIKDDGKVIEIIKSKGITQDYISKGDHILNQWDSINEFIGIFSASYHSSREVETVNYMSLSKLLLKPNSIQITNEMYSLQRDRSTLSITEKNITRSLRTINLKREFLSINTSIPKNIDNNNKINGSGSTGAPVAPIAPAPVAPVSLEVNKVTDSNTLDLINVNCLSEIVPNKIETDVPTNEVNVPEGIDREVIPENITSKSIKSNKNIIKIKSKSSKVVKVLHPGVVKSINFKSKPKIKSNLNNKPRTADPPDTKASPP